MIKKINRFLLLAAMAFGFGLTVNAQQLPDLPVDDAVRIGKLDNGLTYYIRHNDTPKGQADFYIAQKVGSIQEEDNQRGLAHFLEHMCFNGTTNFPGNGIIDWLESKGVKFGYNLNAYTGVEQTVYNISNVPVASTAVQDSCLLILHDWANDLLLDPEEIDKERGVIHQEWRRSMSGQMRILENLLPVIYPNNKYGERLPIGTMEVVDNFPPQALRDYYETWYRPDLQGIIVVGDIDVDYIEGKIKEMFASIEMPENPKERVYLQVEDTPGTIYAIGSDKEMTNGIVDLMFKTDAFPTDQKNNMMYLMVKYMTRMVSLMLDQRLTELGKQPDSPFSQAGASYGNFFLAKTKDMFDVEVVAKGNDVLPGFECVYRELLRAARGGFTVGEYERTRAEYLSQLEKAYNGRDKRENESYVNEYVSNFLDNEPIPSLEDEYQIINQIVPMIPVDAINQILPELITNDNRVLLCMVPDNGEFKIPTEEEFAAIIAKVDAEELEPYKDEMKEEPLIPVLPAPGKVVSVSDNAQWGAQEVILSNGVKVVVKNTDFKKDEILFAAVAIGGTSVIPDTEANNLISAPVLMSASGLGTYSNTDMEKYLQGKQAGLDVELGNYSRELNGHSTVKDLPTLMELIYMTFIDYNITEDDFAATQSMIANLIANQEANPQFIFQRDLSKSLYESPAKHMISADVINSANREAILEVVKGYLANAADFTFYFVGDITVDAITPLLEQYIATLPAIAENASAEYTPNAAREIKAGNTNDTFTTKMETPQTWCAIIINGTLPYTVKNKVTTSIVGQILSNRLLKKIREEMGAVYSISAVAGMQRQGIFNTILQIPFPMKPEMKDEVLKEIYAMLKGMTENITADELNPIKEYMVKQAIEDQEKNDSLLGTLTAVQLTGVDTWNGIVDVINSVTTDDVQNLVKALLDQNNEHIIILDPESAE